MPVTYPKDMREQAKRDGKSLITIDVPGMRYQTPATEEMIDDLHKLCRKWWDKGNKRSQSSRMQKEDDEK